MAIARRTPASTSIVYVFVGVANSRVDIKDSLCSTLELAWAGDALKLPCIPLFEFLTFVRSQSH